MYVFWICAGICNICIVCLCSLHQISEDLTTCVQCFCVEFCSHQCLRNFINYFYGKHCWFTIYYFGWVIWGGRMVQWCWVSFQCRGVLLVWNRVGQGPTVLAVGADGVVWTFFLVFHFSFLSLSLWETARYRLKYCLKGPLKPKQPNGWVIRSNGHRCSSAFLKRCMSPTWASLYRTLLFIVLSGTLFGYIVILSHL